MTTMTKSAFAKHIGKTPGYVTQLLDAGRLVMEGNKVNVEASIARIEATRDPSKAGVANRHAKARQEKSQHEDADAQDKDPIHESVDYQFEKALRERANRQLTEMELAEKAKNLVPVGEVKFVAANAGSIIRSRMESLAYALAPQFAVETDEQRILAGLIDGYDLLMEEFHRQFKKLQQDMQ
jgi:hypothetical protein